MEQSRNVICYKTVHFSVDLLKILWPLLQYFLENLELKPLPHARLYALIFSSQIANIKSFQGWLIEWKFPKERIKNGYEINWKLNKCR